MRKLILVPLFLAIIGTASAVLSVTVNLPGTIVVQNLGLAVTPSSLDFGTVTVDSSSRATGVALLTITNSGNVPLTLTYSCDCQGFSLVLSPAPGVLAPGGIWTGEAQLTIPAGTPGNTYNVQITITGSA